jgi:hypothetical protein
MVAGQAGGNAPKLKSPCRDLLGQQAGKFMTRAPCHRVGEVSAGGMTRRKDENAEARPGQKLIVA